MLISHEHQRVLGRLADGALIVAAIGACAFAGISRFAAPGVPMSGSVAAGMKEVLGQLRGRPLSPLAAIPFSDPHSEITMVPPPGSIVVVFRSDCPHCEATAPSWADLHSQIGPDRQIVALTSDTPEVGKAWLDRLLPSGVRGLSVKPRPWGLPAVPATLALDNEGRVSWAKIGQLSSEDLRKLVSGVSY